MFEKLKNSKFFKNSEIQSLEKFINSKFWKIQNYEKLKNSKFSNIQNCRKFKNSKFWKFPIFKILKYSKTQNFKKFWKIQKLFKTSKRFSLQYLLKTRISIKNLIIKQKLNSKVNQNLANQSRSRKSFKS